MATPVHKRVSLWIAQGFGVGRIPVAPGTFGSLLGLAWTSLLLSPRHAAIFVTGSLTGVALSVWLCGIAEKTLQQKDPASVVLDEIVATPLCFIGWLTVYFQKHGDFPPLDHFLRADSIKLTVVTFVLFRILDILKPWPLRPSQRLPGGWGVTVDDVLAAAGTALITGLLAAQFLGER